MYPCYALAHSVTEPYPRMTPLWERNCKYARVAAKTPTFPKAVGANPLRHGSLSPHNTNASRAVHSRDLVSTGDVLEHGVPDVPNARGIHVNDRRGHEPSVPSLPFGISRPQAQPVVDVGQLSSRPALHKNPKRLALGFFLALLRWLSIRGVEEAICLIDPPSWGPEMNEYEAPAGWGMPTSIRYAPVCLHTDDSTGDFHLGPPKLLTLTARLCVVSKKQDPFPLQRWPARHGRRHNRFSR